MTYLIRTNQAEEDLIEIWLYIATDNRIIADRILDQIEAKCQMLAKNPGIGQ
ncbi:MAG: type II toxin-antitoxin system RelE/ParE family toxin, partial [Dolichospermum sp.]